MRLTAIELGKARPHEVLPGDDDAPVGHSRWAAITREAASRVGGYQALARKLGVAKNAPQNWAAGRNNPSRKYRERMMAIIEEDA